VLRVEPIGSDREIKDGGPDPADYRGEWGRRSQRARAFVRDGIVTGRFPVGAPIVDAEIAGELGISKTPAREALKLLEQEGLLERGPRRQLRVRGLTPEHRDEVLEVREALEQIAVRRACRTMTTDEIDLLRLSLLRQRRATQAGDDSAFIDLDEEFHLAMARASGAHIVARLLGQLGAFVRIMRLGVERTDAQRLRVVEEHEAIVDALEARDEDAAAAALVAHLRAPPAG
jgi:GntR family transcriptional regulator, rspAB operon transcriptional repressor